MKEEEPRRLSRSETHDLSMILRDRTKVLRSHAEEQAAACMADFERQMATCYTFDQDDVWQKATREAQRVVQESQAAIAKRCKELGIPASFAPSISASWQGRGENMLASRRTELRRVAQTSVAAMIKAAITKIEKQALDLRTQVVGMGLRSCFWKALRRSRNRCARSTSPRSKRGWRKSSSCAWRIGGGCMEATDGNAILASD
jgi:hypothetical protein